MFLSNSRSTILFALAGLVLTAGCSWLRTESPPLAPLVAEPKSSSPFETLEPDIFQADFVTSDGTSETRTFYARKAAKTRFDSFSGTEPTLTMIHTDKLYRIDHRARSYAEIPESETPAASPPLVTELTASLLSQSSNSVFEEVGSEGNLDRYSVTSDGVTETVMLTYDTRLKMVVKQELGSPGGAIFVFELRNIKLEVDDSTFEIPNGYKRKGR